MTLQSGQTSEFPELPSHANLGLETCPTCGQEIPPNKLEEISGKIATREREQTFAITALLEKRYAGERTEADAKAKADLESERQQSAARETRLREEVQKAADKLIGERQAEAEQARAELTAAKADAKEREMEIQNEAKRTAEFVAAERISAIEASRLESEGQLQARINEAEASRIAAEQRQAEVAFQLLEMQQMNEAEVAKVREEAASELLRIRQVATEEVETRLRDTITAHESAAAEASAKASEAEARVQALEDQHASAMETNLKAQREILEKATQDAVNAEKARAFEESQKLSTKLDDLQRAFDKKTAEELGEGAEIDVFEALKAEFPDDKISRIPKGTPGADILHVVMLSGKECGTILYDSKNHNQFRNEHVAKLKADQLAARAEHSILSTHKFPQGTRQLYIQDGVILANPARVVFIATIVRQHLLRVHTFRLSGIERESKTAALYEFITSERCSLLLGRIYERADDLAEQQEREIKWHENYWKKQGEAIRSIQKAKVDLENQITMIIGASANDSAMSQAS